MKNKGVVIGGITLILVGIALLVQTLLPYTWPLIAMGVGVAFLSAAASYRLGALAIPGTILLGTGALLLWQSVTGRWGGWLYTWPLVPGFVGLGLVLANVLGMGGQRIRRVGWAWAIEAVGMCALLAAISVLYPRWFSWALILVGLGTMFMLVAILAGVPAKAIPGTILGGLGLMLYWQDATGNWASWSYAWPLVVAFVGLGLALAGALGMGGRSVRKVGWSLVGWSFVVTVVFAAFFALDGRLVRFWPVTLVIAGAWTLLRSALDRGNFLTRESM